MQAYIQIYCGNGKGKTTAAVGASIRGIGAGIPVIFAQFMKDGTSSEISVLKHLEELKKASVLYAKEKFGFSWTLTEEEKVQAKTVYTNLFIDAVQELEKHLQRRRKEEKSKKNDTPEVIFVLDEIISAYNYNMIDQNIVLEWLRNKPESAEVILTGRDPKPELLELAGYVTEMQQQKHIYEQGVMARKGIEW